MAPRKPKHTTAIRTSDSYLSDDPEKRARQLSNLKGVKASERKQIDPPPDGLGPVIDETRLAEIEAMDILTFMRECCGIDLYPGQQVALKLAYGIPLDGDEEWEIYRIMTGQQAYTDVDGEVIAPQLPTELQGQHNVGREALELVVSCGARGGKSTVITSGCALYETFARGRTWRKYLRKGETGYAVIVATRLDQAKDIIQKNCANIIMESPYLRDFLADEPKNCKIETLLGLNIVSLPCNSTAGRGIPVFFLCFDEFAHFRADGVNTGESVYGSLSPRQAQFPGSKTVFPSTPAAMQGMFWTLHQQGFGAEDRITLQAPSKILNPTIPDSFLQRQKRIDPDNYKREFLAIFAQRMSAFFPQKDLERAFTLDGDQPFVRGHAYACAIDQSGMSGRDKFAIAIAHQENGAVVNDAVRVLDTKELDVAMAEILQLCEQYGIRVVQHDRYASGWVTNALNRIGIEGEISPQLPIVYNNAKSLMISSKLYLQSNTELMNGMANTMAFFGKNNTMSIYHERTADGHGDIADAVVRAAHAASMIKPTEIEDQIVLRYNAMAAHPSPIGGWRYR